MLQLTSISNQRIRGTRKVWVERGERDDHCCIFLDAELYIERVHAPEIVREMFGENNEPAATCIYLSFGESIDRHIDFACNEEFASFLAKDLCPWIDSLTERTNDFVLCGLSLSGLAAAFAAHRYPQVFRRTLCQSPSAWWNDEWLTGQIQDPALDRSKCWISVGDRETEENVTHDPTGMVQKTSQISSVRRLALAMGSSGVDVRVNLIAGGHDPTCWAAELPSALRWLLHGG
jgi:enterochelin esterase family protein